MLVEIYGPNLPRALADKGTLHVHRAACADTHKLRRLARLDEPWTIEADSRRAVVYDIYPPGEFEYTGADDPSYAAYRTDVYFAPCVQLPEHPASAAAEERLGRDCASPHDILVAALEGEGINGGVYCGEAADVLELFTWPEVRAAMRAWLDDKCPDGDSYAGRGGA